MQDQPQPTDTGGRACGTCRFVDVVAIDPGTLQKIRVCRRFPPMPVIQVGPNGQPGMSMQFPNAHPMVWETHYCHEYAPEIPSAIKQISHEKTPPKLTQN